jgi:elongation factor 3
MSADKVAELFKKLSLSATPEDRDAASADVVKAVKADGVRSLAAVAEQLKAALEETSSREAALVTFKLLVTEFGAKAEPYLFPLLPALLERASDKVPAVRTGAEAAATALFASLNPYSTENALPALFDGMQQQRNWQTKVLALNLLAGLAKTAPTQIAYCLHEIVPRLTDSMADAKEQVKAATTVALTETFAVNGNRDITQFLPALIGCIARPAETTDCIHKLAATTFVQQVEGAPLSIIVPLLVRGLRERTTAIKRKSAVIIDNMAKLVENPHDAAPFLPKLLPELEKVSNEVADPECRKVAANAHATLLRVGGEGKLSAPKKADVEAMKERLSSALGAKASSVEASTLTYAASLVCQLCNFKNWMASEWTKVVTPYLAAFVSQEEAQGAVTSLLTQSKEDAEKEAAAAQEEEEGGEDLCNCEFSLAYGAKILLSMAKLRLKKGKRYGLCGPNGAGKSTLMRAIANGQVEGFPTQDQLKTIYVEHDIDSEEADTPSLDFVANDPRLGGAPREEVEKMLVSVGFSEEYLRKPVGSLSGGWKMKLALARAILMKAQILLLDEPTNHLDVKNVAWLENYLNSLTDVTSIMVSHDSGFLDRVCTHILNYEGRKLKCYRGNLSEFVKQYPAAKSYYELTNANVAFKFPEPGYLEGVKTKDKAILKMIKMGYKYPGAEKNTVSDISLYCTLSSRVVVHGANGAGKSTMIKVLCGEAEPTEGTCWKHPNLRIAYVAQHAFHHLEQHLEKTPNQYIQWRYAIGEDREALTKVDRKLTEEEEKKMKQVLVIDGVKRVVEKILGRRKLKSSYEYEVQWVGCHPDQNTYLPRDELVQMGFEKLVNEVDAKEAAAQGLYAKPLTALNISKHLEDFGLDTEFSTHSLMRGLSGGQKVKVVLGAAMWNNPHMLVLDEPTNYLDRDSLGALAESIKAFGGGVIMITHNQEFSSAICSETWNVADGRMTPSGQAPGGGSKEKVEFKQEEETTDAFGNVIKIKAAKKLKMSNKEKKALQKLREARKARGEEVTDSEEDA